MSEAVLVQVDGELTLVERSALAECEAVIERNLTVFYETGQALLKIRDGRLYRVTHGTFEEYCRERWGWGRNYTNKVIMASEVVGNLSSGYNCTQVPATESQARELASLEPEQQREVWQKAVETAPNGHVTAAHVRETRESLEGPAPSAPISIKVYLDTEEAAEKIKPHVAHNSGNNEWYTPVEYIEAARAVLGAFGLDPASSAVANSIVKAKKFYTAEDDGLSKKWKGRVWMNPPYSGDLIGKFTSKLCHHFDEGDIAEAIVLVNNATETAWFQEMLALASAVCFPKGRIRYLDATGQPANAPLQGQAFLYFGSRPEAFKAEFAQFGGVR
jgi:phage N-6-adenine-methyltransferase